MEIIYFVFCQTIWQEVFMNDKEEEFEKLFDAFTSTAAMCTTKLDNKMCTDEDCKNCSLYQYLNNCLNQLPDIYKLRAIKEIEEKFNNIESKMEKKEEKQYATGKDAFWIKADFYAREIGGMIATALCIIFIPLLCLILPVACSACVFGQSLRDYDYTRYALPGEAGYAGKYRKQILDTLDKTQMYVTDINDDGEINCIDYACTFKSLWDKSYDPANCEIVRNKSNTMNHLFIRTRQYAGRAWECIEPQAAKKEITKYFMEDFWSASEYNPLYNIYGETELWMKEFKQ